jgi:hypothetical protein
MNHEQLTTVNDTELATAVKESLTSVHMNIPLETIVSHGRKVRARRRLPGLAGALAVIAAAAIAVTALPGHRANSAAPRAVELVADRAAAAALSWPSVRPGQWIYREIKFYYTGYPSGPAGDGPDRTWTTAAGTPSHADKGPYAIVVAGAIPYSELGSLPSDPAALERYLGDHPLHSLLPFPIAQSGPAGHAAAAFQQIYGMLWDYALPPKLAAELFQRARRHPRDHCAAPRHGRRRPARNRIRAATGRILGEGLGETLGGKVEAHGRRGAHPQPVPLHAHGCGEKGHSVSTEAPPWTGNHYLELYLPAGDRPAGIRLPARGSPIVLRAVTHPVPSH